MAPLRKKARRMNTRNRPSSTQEELVDTDSDDDIVLEVNATTTATTPFGKENRPPLLTPVLTQGTANAVETLFLIKQEERHEFLHNSANKAGYQVLEDGTKVWGVTREQQLLLDSTPEPEQQQQITRKRVGPIANPYAKPTTTPSTRPTNSTATTATRASVPLPPCPPPEDQSESDSDDDLAKHISANLIEDDCMLYTEEERKTIQTKRGKNDTKYEVRKEATELRFFEILKEFGGPHIQPLLAFAPAKYNNKINSD